MSSNVDQMKKKPAIFKLPVGYRLDGAHPELLSQSVSIGCIFLRFEK